MAALKKIDVYDQHEKLLEAQKWAAQEEYEKFVNDPKQRYNINELAIETYESILTGTRVEERRQLNNVRFKEHEKNRPPAQSWWELSSKEFNKELYRNRVALKPNNSNTVYLEKLRDPYIY